MKKLISIFLAVVLVAMLATTAIAAGTPTISASYETTTGENVTVSVSIANNPGFTVLAVQLEYPEALELVSMTKGLMTGYVANGMANHSTVDPVNGDGVLFTATFKVKATVAKEYPVNVTVIEMLDGEYKLVTPSAVNGKITVKVPPCATHTFGEYTGTEPTCTEDGVKTATCSVCGEKDTKTTTAPGHSYGQWEKDGENHTRTCSKCPAKESAAHTWNDGVITKPATCKEEGVTTFTCTVTGCGATKTSPIAKLNTHTYGDWSKVNDTTHKRICSVCSKEDTANHTWNSGSITTQPSCYQPGVKTITCTGCGATKTESVPATNNHTYGQWTKVEGTDNHTHKCTVTGCTATETKPHTWKGEITTQPSCKDDGEMTYICTGCKATKTEVIEATGDHVYTNWTKVDDKQHEGTCGCGATIKKNHNFDKGVVTTQPTCKNDGIMTYTCSDCAGKVTEVIKATGEHVYTNWTKVDDKGHKGTCGCGATTTEAHKWDAGKVTTDATCGKDGVKTFGCSICKGTKTEAIKATGKHDYTKSYKDNGDGTHSALCACGAAEAEKHDFSVEGPITVKPSTSNAGKQDILCVCGAKTVKTLPQLPADLDDVPKTGDITIQVTLAVVSMLSLAAAAAYVFNRKIAK